MRPALRITLFALIARVLHCAQYGSSCFGAGSFVHCDECGHCISRQSQEDGTHVHKPGRWCSVALAHLVECRSHSLVSMKQDCPCCLEVHATRQRPWCRSIVPRICSRQRGRPPRFPAATTFTCIVSISTLGRSRGLAAPSAGRLPCMPPPSLPSHLLLFTPCVNMSQNQARAMSAYIDQEIARCACVCAAGCC